jgi:integrase
VLFFRTKEGRQRWFTIGKHGSPWTPETARAEARRLLGDVERRIDPAAEKQKVRNAETVAKLCNEYLAAAEAGRILKRDGKPKKSSTISLDRGRVERHIKPLLGRHKVGAVTRRDIEAFLHDVAEGKTAKTVKTGPRGLARVSGGKTTATRTVALLGAIFAYAARQNMRSDNPVHGVRRFADGKRERRLSDIEYKALGAALGKAKHIWPPAVAVARFLILSGWRTGEALALRRSEIDISQRIAILGDTKTGQSLRPLSNAASAVLREMEKLGANGDLVFPATRAGVVMSGFKRFWRTIAKLGGLPKDVTPHTLRHSFASVAGDLEYSDATIGALIGHKGGRTTTSRYRHQADAVLLAAADAVSNRIATLMEKGNAGAAQPTSRVEW